MTTTEAEDVAAKILALPPTGGNVAYYVWDEAEDVAIRRAIVGACRRRRFFVASSGGGNGHEWLTVLPCGMAPPRSCSGTRGRGRRKASQDRRRRGRYAAVPPMSMTMGDAVKAGDVSLMAHPWARERRGPKGDRLAGWRKLWKL